MYRTLIVEDNTDFRQSLNFMLSCHFPSMVIAEAGNGKDAMKQVDNFEPNLVFMDIKLPDGNGLNLTKTIKSDHADTTVIIMTAYDFPEYRQAATEAGASYFIPKGSLGEESVLSLVEFVMTDDPSLG